MKLLAVTLLALVALVSSRSIEIEDVIGVEQLTAYDYHNRVGIPRAEAIRAYEASPQSRITGGQHAHLGRHPYQAGLLIDLRRGGTSVCGGSVISPWRVLTAAHCWLDGHTPAFRLTVVLGSIWLFSGGVRIVTDNVVAHPGWTPSHIRNDVAMIRLPWALGFSGEIAPIALPHGSGVHQTFVGYWLTASGFGGTGDGHPITQQQRLSTVDLPGISNEECARTFGIIVPSTLCASGAGGRSTCGGDSGGPLTAVYNNQRILVGVVSFGAAAGCQRGLPVGFARVTYFLPWIHSNL